MKIKDCSKPIINDKKFNHYINLYNYNPLRYISKNRYKNQSLKPVIKYR
jgi:hypothetical protein